jgi:single-stranded-DNA-specific exonuclease RecJ
MKIKPFIETQPKTNALIHENPVLNRVFQNRGVQSSAEIEYSLSKLLSPSLMKGMDKGTDILINHILADSKIVIVGDYDCDGATATTIAVEGLKLMGAKNVFFMVPDRVKHGYGLTPQIVDIVSEYEPDLIVTVDNGISSFAGAEAIKKLTKPCQLLITDHHLAAEEGLPDADAIINPNQPGCSFPSKNIAGCGVMFYVIMGLRAKMRERSVFNKLGMTEPLINRLFDVLALGTVADVVTLDYNNRIMINAGLELINKGMARPGIKAVLELKGRRIGDIVAMDMGFAAGPCFNAAGRLDDMRLGINCMLESNTMIAEDYAKRLFDLNEQRKELGSEMEEEALELLDNLQIESTTFGICLHDPMWHEGVIGILASRIKERLSRPVIIFTDTHQASSVRESIIEAKIEGASAAVINEMQGILNEMDIKGSSRSVPGVHLKHILDHINKTNPEILSKFGGHAMAAGLSLKVGHFEKFKSLFDELVRKDLTEDMILGRVDIDIKDIDPELINLETAELLRKQGPWGQNFTQPLFSQQFIVKSYRILKGKHLKMVVSPIGSDKTFDAIAFGCVENDEIPFRDKLEASFSMDINEWRGNRTLQLMIHHLQDKELILEKEINSKSEDVFFEKKGAIKQQSDDLLIKTIANEKKFEPIIAPF